MHNYYDLHISGKTLMGVDTNCLTGPNINILQQSAECKSLNNKTSACFYLYKLFWVF